MQRGLWIVLTGLEMKLPETQNAKGGSPASGLMQTLIMPKISSHLRVNSWPQSSVVSLNNRIRNPFFFSSFFLSLCTTFSFCHRARAEIRLLSAGEATILTHKMLSTGPGIGGTTRRDASQQSSGINFHLGRRQSSAGEDKRKCKRKKKKESAPDRKKICILRWRETDTAATTITFMVHLSSGQNERNPV